jgi:hypothetical protein
MTTIYNILALFFCSHHYEFVKEYTKEIPDYEMTGPYTYRSYTRTDYYRVSRCSKCGKEHVVEI